MDVCERLHRAQQAAADGQHDEALREYIWFHEHALDFEPSLYGVRLSFAMGYWLDLAKVYPEALRALKDIRDQKTQRLLAGDGNRELFHDVESINEHLKDERATYEMFLKLNAANPSLARSCVSLAMPAIVKSGDCHLARRFIADPFEKIQRWSTTLNEDIANLANEPSRETPVQDTYVHIYVERINLLLSVLNGTGEYENAERLRASALESIESPLVREAVRVALESSSETEA